MSAARVLVAVLSWVPCLAAAAAQAPVPLADLPPRFQTWLEEVRPLITGSEYALFLQLDEDYQREAFVDSFWRVRDPYPQTARNEMRERYEERVAYARANFDGLDDDRARILLVHGPPGREVPVRCTTTRTPAILWAYTRSDQVDFGFVLIFLRGAGGTRPARLWQPGRSGGVEEPLRAARHCINGGLLEQVSRDLYSLGAEYDLKLRSILAKPRPRSLEWVAAFYASSTELPADAPTFDAELAVEYLGRHQSRTVVQGSLQIDPQALRLGDFAGHRSYDLQLVGEVVHDGRLLEGFRYKFGFPEAAGDGALPLVFQRYLRPGAYRLLLRVEDLNAGSYFRAEREIEVPRLELAFTRPEIADTETARIYAEATAAIESGDDTLRVVPPAGGVKTGLVRFDTVVTGKAIQRVLFRLDGGAEVIKNRPPFNVELDLGPFPRLHTLEVSGYDVDGRLIADDAIQLNAGGERFRVRLLQPRTGERASASLLARAEVDIPKGSTLERVEFLLNEEPVATLYQEPFSQPLVLGDPGALTLVRAVAYLADGNQADDHVFVNAPAELEQLEVQFVELYAAVSDRFGRPIDGLGRDSFRVLEDGVEQSVTRFERVEDLPIHVGVVIDNSASMHHALQATRQAALEFFERTIEAQDRAALITFNRLPNLAVQLTNDLRALGGGLAGLTAEGQTALYDSLMFALYYLTGVSGQRAILLLSDGRDEVSRYDFDATLDYARRAGVTIYAVGLQLPDGFARGALTAIAEETGGQSYFVRDVADLPEIYRAIEGEMRSQYLLAYQSSNTSKAEAFRTIEVRVAEPGAKVRAMSGYYP
ncbi:MAG TPA: VWA domain-containing protein [Thermoanaerobaculia bacterium]|nr:VWA domain-containing protein [Thermoanaerobaculia bacterium]